MLTLKTGKSASYQFTFQPNDSNDDAFICDLRELVNACNKIGRHVHGHEWKTVRVSLSARKGFNNPYQWKYDNKHKRRLRLEDAAEVDVYVTPSFSRRAESGA